MKLVRIAIVFACLIQEVSAAQVKISGTTLLISGVIEPGDASKVAKAIARGSKTPLPPITGDATFDFPAFNTMKGIGRITMNSRGGDLLEASVIGEIIRQTGGWKTIPVEIKAGSKCLSACAVIALMNKGRVSKKADIGVHNPYWIDQSGKKTRLDEQMTMALIGFGIPTKTARWMAETPPDEIRLLTVEEIAYMRKWDDLDWEITE